MKFTMNYNIIGRNNKKYFLWTLYNEDDEENFKFEEFRVCDCFLDWTLCFRYNFKDDLHSEQAMTDFFVEIPSDHITTDIYAFFGTITILCCQKALYHFSYMDDIDEDYFLKECLAYQTDMRCMYFLQKIMFFEFICSNCQFNFINTVSKKLTKIKND